MDRPLRAFQPAALPLEGRILLVWMYRYLRPPSPSPPSPSAPSPPAASSGSVFFSGALGPAASTHQVVQQGGEATVWLQRAPAGPARFQLADRPAGSSGDRPDIAGRGRELARGEADGHFRPRTDSSLRDHLDERGCLKPGRSGCQPDDHAHRSATRPYSPWAARAEDHDAGCEGSTKDHWRGWHPRWHQTHVQQADEPCPGLQRA